MLIQVQKGKVDLQVALLAVDKLLRANELNFCLLTFIPAAYLAYSGAKSLYSLSFNKSQKLVAKRRKEAVLQLDRLANLSEGSHVYRGLFLISLYRLSTCLFTDSDTRWTREICDLANPQLSDEQRRWTVQRMYRMV